MQTIISIEKLGKVYASGVPRLAAYGKWVLAYDPRKDSTFPGGSGSHRIGAAQHASANRRQPSEVIHRAWRSLAAEVDPRIDVAARWSLPAGR